MTITVTDIDQGPFVATGAAQTVPYTFMTLTDGEIDVFYDVGAGRVLIDPALHTVVRNKNVDNSAKEGGSVELLAAAAPAGSSIYLRAAPRFDRDVTWSDVGSRLRNLNDENDRAVLRDLVLQIDVDAFNAIASGVYAARDEAVVAAGVSVGVETAVNDALQQILEVASGAPDAPSILNKIDKDTGNMTNSEKVVFRGGMQVSNTVTSDAVPPAEVADTAYAAGAFAQLKPDEVSNLTMVAASFTEQCTWLGSQFAGQSDAMNLAVPDGYHLINGNCSVTGAGQKVNLVGSGIPDFITATAVAISTISANQYEAEVTVATPLPARVVVNYALGMQNFKGDNGAESVNGCHQVTSIAPDRLSFKFQYRAFGIVPTSPTTLDMATTMGLLACRVVVYKACLRVSYLGWTGGAQIGFLNARKGASISGKWCSISYDGPAGDHCIAYAEGAGAAVYLTDYFGIAGAGDKVVRSGTGGHIYTNRACLGGGLTAAEIWQGFGGTASFARTMMGSVATSILTPTAASSYVAVSCVVVGAPYLTRTTYEDSSGSWGTSTLAFGSWALGVTRGKVNIDAASMVKKCTFPILPSIGGIVAGDFVASENTNAAVASNTILANGGVWSRIPAMNVQTLPRIQAALDFPSIAAGAYQDLTISYPGAALGDYVIGGRTTTLPGQAVLYTYFVSLADVVTVRAMNFSAAAIDPTGATHRVSVVKSA